MGHYRMIIEMDGMQFVGNWQGNVTTLEEIENLKKLAKGIFKETFAACKLNASVNVQINGMITLVSYFESKIGEEFFR